MIHSTVMIRIEGIDDKKGLANCNGSEEAYVEVLESFLEDTHAKIIDLRFFDAAITRHWTPPELSRFSFAVHAIKGISTIIGATLLSEQAAGLEAAAQSGGIKQIKKEFPEFFMYLKALTERIREFLKTIPRAAATEE